ncbi:MAG: MBL fold metallo-hydrolase [Parasporobacterium sp.]|nr:MBL fold metallo-hydrolase [Parasporobacterium sp.]
MRLMNIASGSSGNATYVGTDHTHILIDSGVSRKRIMEGLKRLDLSLKDLDAVLITHEHSDHIASLAMVEKASLIPVYTSEGTARQLQEKEMIPQELLHPVGKEQPFRIGDLRITALPTSHDAADPVCYRLSDGRSDCAVVTDLGTYDEALVRQLQGLDAVVLEANHDVRMLEAGPYPYPLKRRIAGKKGHLSNEDSGRLLSRILHDHLKYIALAHLSRKNNTEDLARLSVAWEIDLGECSYRGDDFPIAVADQAVGTEIFMF